ncbi:MAG: TfoX/Sxy family protein [Candidatus Marinimicrobia bacterium]|nr:TfoX/Sxy family protein [Candidatus Neomarinimicrobiota bacterium]
MAYNTYLADRIRNQLGNNPMVEEKKMFGDVGFLIHGNMACGVNQDNLIVRIGPEMYHPALTQEYVAEFDITGRPMKGWIMVGEKGYTGDKDLEFWIESGIRFAASLPSKKPENFKL